MADQRLSIINWSSLPDDALVFTEPVKLNFHTAGIHNPLMLVLGITAGSDIKLGMDFKVPEDYVGSPVIEVDWSTVAAIASSLKFAAGFDYNTAAETETWAHTAAQEVVIGNQAHSNVAQRGHRLTMALAANFTKTDNVMASFYRDDSVDDLAAIVYIRDIVFKYSDT